MQQLYPWLKFIHVLSIAGWLGGFITLAVLNGVARRQPDSATVATYLRYSQALGPRLIGPASGLALLSGIAMMMVGHLGVPLWLLWGLIAAALFIAVGVLFLRPLLSRLQSATAAPGPSTDLPHLLARQRLFLWVNAALLASAVWAMVLKPT